MNFAVVFLVIFSLEIHSSAERTKFQPMDDLWESYKEEYDKEYASKEQEDIARINFENWAVEVLEHNMDDDKKYSKAINSLSDMTHEDIRNTMMGALDPRFDDDGGKVIDFSNKTIERSGSLDYSTHGIMSSVKDQGQCGSCWAFAATEAVESHYAMKYGYVPVLSPQQLVDCSGGYGNSGCNSGYLTNAFKYLVENGGSVTENCYPYKERENNHCSSGNCRKYKVSDYIRVSPSGDEDALRNALIEAGPVAVTIYASHHFHQIGRNSGIFYDSDCNNRGTNHIILLVGYGTRDGNDYWKIRNSWGAGWGDQGYAYMARNNNNMCKIASYASFPIVS